MPDDYRISDLSTAPSIGNSDLMELSVVNTASETGYTSMKAPVLNIANKIVNATQYVSDLQTQNKTITGAINEIAQGGGGGGDADIVKTESGNPCSFSTKYAGALKSLTADIVCGGGGGTPSTPIPLVGHSELNLTRCGVNLLDNADILTWKVYGNSTFSVDSSDNLIVELQDSIAEGSETQFISLPEGTYTLAIDTAQRIQIAWGGVKNVDVYNTTNVQFTLTEFRNDIHFKIICSSYPTNVGKIRITLGSDVKPYEPYNGIPYTVAFGQTVYGGVYDAKTGSLTITHAIKDLGDLTWNYASGSGLFYSYGLSDAYAPQGDNTYIANALCTIFGVKSREDLPNNNYCFSINYSDTKYLSVKDTDYSDPNDFKTAVTGQKLVYELDTPIVISVQSISVLSVNGTNNIISDGGGDVSVEYYTDLAEDIKDFIGDGVEVGDLANVEITTPSNNQVLKYDATSQKWVNGTGGGGASWVDVTGTLVAGQTSITLSDASITTSSTIDYYTDTFGVNPTNVSVVTGAITLTFDSQASDLGVKVRVS